MSLVSRPRQSVVFAAIPRGKKCSLCANEFYDLASLRSSLTVLQHPSPSIDSYAEQCKVIAVC
eukprot:scaffold25646_cov64-Cyclotella_meneghiniana.AAC.7